MKEAEKKKANNTMLRSSRVEWKRTGSGGYAQPIKGLKC